MKRVGLVVALVALAGMTISAFADVQNIRLSGDIRVRGYFLSGVQHDNIANNGGLEEATFVAQRTRVTCEADLEDHVLAVVTLSAEGLWGDDNRTDTAAGAGDPLINRSWAVGINEAYLQMNEAFFTPATVKLGRQYLNYGRGLILSSNEGEYNFDAARVVLDYYPLTIDLVGGMLDSRQAFEAYETKGKANLLFANARYELADSILKDVEAYVGWVSQNGKNPLQNDRVPPTAENGESPWIIGLRADLNLTKNLNAWVEGVYEGGDAGSSGNESLSAGLINVGCRLTLADVKMTPVINANYIYASGGGSEGEHDFRPWFDYPEGYNGFVFKPMMSNVQIINLGASIKPANNLTLALQGYYYFAVNGDYGLWANYNLDVPSEIEGHNGKREIGSELDTILTYDYSKDVRCQLIYGMFIPGIGVSDAPTTWHIDRVAHGIRGEVNVKF